MKTCNLKTQILAFMLVLMIPLGLGAARVWAGWWTNYTNASMDETIYNRCQNNLPLPTDRTTIGIGESVTVWIDTDTFSDTDKWNYTWEECGTVKQSFDLVEDYIGKTIWTVTADLKHASGLPTGNSSSLTVTAIKVASDSSGTVSWVVHDTETRYTDTPISISEKEFTIRVPNSVIPLGETDVPLGIAVPTGNYMGVNAWYCLQVLPNNVNFNQVTIGENIPTVVFAWPDGYNYTFSAQTEHGCSDRDNPYDAPTTIHPNIFFDHLWWYYHPTSRLVITGSSPPKRTDYKQDYLQAMRFKDKDDVWHTFYSHNLTWHFQASDNRGRTHWDSVYESWRGPFF